MSIFDHPDYDKHESISFINDASTGLKAIIAVHNTNLGPSVGGCRMFPYANSHAALADVLRLSSGMSYKAAMAGLPQGGGKAVIIGDPKTDKSHALMQAMGKFVNSCDGKYIIAEDSGISVADVNQMAKKTKFAGGNTAQYSIDGLPADGNPAPATSLGVFHSIQVAVEHVFNSDLTGKKVAIQGVGHVGLRLAKLLHEAGCELMVSDIFDDNLLIAEKQFGATIVSNSDIHKLDVDIFSPCALGGAINENTITSLGASIIAGAANNQLATNEMDRLLLEKGICYVPDYLANAGGIIDIHYQSIKNGSNVGLCERVAGISNTVRAVLEESSSTGIPTQTVANMKAEKILYSA
ncbi:Glu/Leu/Phe/Val family dehydrogenase [Glaciecola petra]|uniref:Glu/Leu/Phe/Val dehydrogenase dimerization domain-containing protein n=1 Tax=Glaciecola petra TaxID=3075602 RepID=A0ABU2ZP95_9ALTE|nr:Glu/Leu/Phe/Val dehydrogenase dimerization domain-containing protein [Aestuariibacter sp. P117]MDT0593873.1 Glu/Leu/Phe/Val dehydrogenase dimerization domain-containing protein [Aestuariibacter sp. P117]